MAGGAQVLMRNPNAGQSQGIKSDNTPFDDFIRENLGHVLMKMSPQDNFLFNGAQNWFLADEKQETVLIYSLKGNEILLAEKLRQKNYSGIWFNESTGKTIPVETNINPAKGSTIKKPNDGVWLLLLKG
jgi:hypothetical protein